MKKRILSMILVVAMLLSLAPVTMAKESGFAPAQTPAETTTNPVGLVQSTEEEQTSGFATSEAPMEKYENGADNRFSVNFDSNEPEATDKVTFMVEMAQQPQLEKFSAEDIAANTASVQAYNREQVQTLDTLKAEVTKVLADSETFEIGYTYTVAMTGFSVTTEYGNKAAIAALPGVESVYVAPVFEVPVNVGTSASDEEVLGPMTNNSNTMIGANILNDLGYTGKGQKIAILDTGLVLDHPNFQAMSEDKITESSLTKEDVEAVWSTLNAASIANSRFYGYRNNKVPYFFNYYMGNFDVSHDTAGSDHGTHVAGIAAANKVESSDITGMAPDAQVLVMQVFSYNGAGWDTITAALEDTVRLGADTVNLSLGAAGGFTDGNKEMSGVMEMFEETGMELLIAAGNDTNSAYGNLHGLNMSLSGNPDIGLTGTPSTFPQAISIASVDNDGARQLYFTVEGENVGFSDSASSDNTKFITKFIGQTLQYVMVPGYGTAADYAELDVTGKVAVVSRGGNVSFPEKQQYAQDAGAIACVVYNNVPGTILMQINDGGDNIPCVSISQASGQWMALKAQEGKNSLTVCNGDMITVKLVRTVSDFSTWGVMPDMKLKPELAGVGGNILSTRDPDMAGSWYGSMSGTSMATPQVAGAMAVLLQYLKENTDLEGKDLRIAAANLALSTADPVMYSELEYTPRAQGAGLINLVEATTSKAYLSNPDSFEERAKAEMGDNPSKSGKFDFTFEIHNTSDEALTYTFDSSIFTETLYMDSYIGNMPRALDAKVEVVSVGNLSVYDYNVDGQLTTADARILLQYINNLVSIAEGLVADVNNDGEVNMNDVTYFLSYLAELDVGMAETTTAAVTVPAGETVSLKAKIVLSEADKEYMNAFENGIWVEGFFYVNSADEDGVNLNMPVLGFYGDWSDAPVFDSEDANEASLYPRYAFTNMAQLGTNPYITGGKAGDEYNAFSYDNPFAELDVGLLRGAKYMDFTVTDVETGEEYWSISGSEIAKSYYSASYGMVIPFYVVAGNDENSEVWRGYDQDGNELEDGTKIRYTVEAYVDDGDRIVDDTWEFEATLDKFAPEIVNADTLQDSLIIDEASGKLSLTLSILDNQYVAALLFVDNKGNIMAKYEVDNTPGKVFTETYDITGYGNNFSIVVGDYACNEIEIEAVLDLGVMAGVKPQIKELSKDRLYGCEIAFIPEVSRGWFSGNKTDMSDMRNEVFDASVLYYSAEYVNGYIIAQRADNGNIEVLTPYNTYWGAQTILEQTATIGKQGSFVFYDMALDHSGQETETWTGRTDTLYAVGWSYEGESNDDGRNVLYKLMINKQGYTYESIVGEITGLKAGAEALTLGCTTDGVLYTIDHNGELYTLNKQTAEATHVATTTFPDHPQYVGVNVIQSMAYDHNTGKMYWAAHSQNTNGAYVTVLSSIFELDLETGECTPLNGYNESGCTSLFIPNDLESDYLVFGGDPTNVSIDTYQATLLEGQTKLLSVTCSPWYADLRPVTWSSSDEEIATVNSVGLVTALKPGNVTITATTERWNEWGGEPDENWNYPGAWETATVSCQIEVVKSEPELYAFNIVDYKNSSNNQAWITFADTAPKKVSNLGQQFTPTEDEYGNPAVALAIWQGGAYYNGYVYTVQMEGWTEENEEGITIMYSGTALYRSEVERGETPADTRMTNMTLIGRTSGIEIGNISFDYNSGRMYGVDQTNGGLAIIDLETGSVDPLGVFQGDLGPSAMPAMTVARDLNDESVIIGSDMDGNLYTVDPDTMNCKLIGSAGAEFWYYGGMGYDYNTGSIYWTPCNNSGQSPFYMVRLVEEWGELKANIIDLGDVSSNSGTEITVLFAIPDEEPETKFIHTEGIDITNGDTATGLVGGSLKLNVVTTPARPTVNAKTYTSSNEDIATVDHFGTVYFHNVGEAVITVTTQNKGDRTDSFSDSITVQVLEAGGELQSFMVDDSFGGSSYYDFWLTIDDFSVSTGHIGISAINTYSLLAAEYYDGFWYGYDKDGSFYRIDNDDRMNYVKLGQANLLYEDYDKPDQVTDMAIDYTTGIMYGLTHTGKLATIDMDTGYVTTIGDVGAKAYALACDMDGTLYAAGSPGVYDTASLYILNKTTGAVETTLGEIPGAVVHTGAFYYGGAMYNSQMTYDPTLNRLYLNATSCEKWHHENTGLYMIQLDETDESKYTCYDLGNPAVKFDRGSHKIGDMYLGAMAHIPEADEIPVGPVNGIMLNKTFATIAVEGTTTLVASIRPSNAANQNVIWSTSDSDVATVDANGVVTGVGNGTAIITATSEANSEVTMTAEITVITRRENPSVAYTFSSDLNALVTFDPQLPSSTMEVLETFYGAANVRGINVVGSTLYYAEINTGYYPMLYAYDLTTHVSKAIGWLYVFSDQLSDIAYDPVENYFYVTAGFYIHKFDPQYLSPTSVNYQVAYIDITNWDYSYPTLGAVEYVDGYVYFTGKGYQGDTFFRIDDTLDGNTLEPDLFHMQLQSDADNIEMNYDPSVELFYITDADNKVHAFDLEGNFTAVDALGEGYDVNGLGIVPGK